ncbi:MAG: helix-turn-helix domain-containing protein [Ferruginibacter sp.]
MSILNNKEVGERLIKARGDLSSRKYAVKANIDPSQYNKIEKGELPLTKNILKKLVDTYGIKKDSILFGGIVPQDTPNKHEAVEIKGAHNENILTTPGITPLPGGKFLMNTPLVPVKAYAGYLTGWGDEEYISELPIHPIIVDKAHRGEYISFEVKGDSMDDGTANAIQEGDIITGRRLDRAHWRSKLHLKKFSDFVIVSMNGIVVKEIIDHNTDTGILVCHSLNNDKKQYPDFDLSFDKVIQIFNVVQVTKKRKR